MAKQKKCSQCGKGFQASNSMQKVCSLECALKVGRKKAAQEKQQKSAKKKFQPEVLKSVGGE